MKRTIIATSLLATVLLLLTPSIPYLQYSSIVSANTTQRIQQLQTIEKNGIEEQHKPIDLSRLKDALRKLPGNEIRQKIKENFNTKFQNLGDKFLRVLLLCALIAYLVTYSIGGSIGYAIDAVLYLLTRGKWEFLTAATLAFLPSEFFFWIILMILEIGMNRYGWPFPDYPGIHFSLEKTNELVISQKCS